ncbi:MAG: rod shape-determining protein MreC [Defluviitaleaceae bacterium]|nr:rod shape-determining protein MreC [Defluviitaleaceae bacterium]
MKFLKEHKLFFIAIMSFLCVLLIFLTLNREEPNPITDALSFVTVPIMSFSSNISIWFGNIFSGNEIAHENTQLRQRIEDMQIQLARLEELEEIYTELTGLLEMNSRFGHLNTRGANIIARTSNNWNTEFIIDLGYIDGMLVNMPVFADNGLVGRIISVNNNHSTVLPIIDDTSWVSAAIRRSGEVGGAVGDINLSLFGQLRFEFETGSDVIVGDKVVTSNHGVNFPPGLPIGTISEVPETGGRGNIIITPGANFRTMTTVLVITD